MGYQFIHVECYGRATPKKGKTGGHNINTILAEASRQNGDCPHVKNPQPPTPLYGVSLSEVEDRCHEWALNSKDTRGHVLRKDALCLLAGVVSVPPDFEDWDSYKKRVVEWMAEHYGDRLLSVVEHLDEPQKHLHWYCVPRLGERFEVLHAGRQAAADAKAAGKAKGEQNLAYCEAMRAFQKAFYGVSKRYGLLPLGANKRRLTRAAWLAEKEQAKALAAMRDRAKRIEAASITTAEKIIQQAKAESFQVIEEAKVEAEKSVEKIKNSASFGAMVGAFFGAMQEKVFGTTSSLRSMVEDLARQVEHHREQAKRLRREREAAKQDAKEQAKADRLQLEASEIKRRKAEAKADALALDLAKERDPYANTPTPPDSGTARKKGHGV